MLKDTTTDVNQWNNVMVQNLIPVDLGLECSFNSHQVSTTIMVNPCPHHDITITETIICSKKLGSGKTVTWYLTMLFFIPLCNNVKECKL